MFCYSARHTAVNAVLIETDGKLRYQSVEEPVFLYMLNLIWIQISVKVRLNINMLGPCKAGLDMVWARPRLGLDEHESRLDRKRPRLFPIRARLC